MFSDLWSDVCQQNETGTLNLASSSGQIQLVNNTNDWWFERV